MDRRITLVGVTSLVIVALVIALNIWLGKPEPLNGTAYAEPYPAAPDFQLKNAVNDTVSLEDYKGKIVLLFFGYTYCPDVCPTTLAELKLAMDLLGEDASQVQVIFISVDPGRDTSEKMQKFVERFYPTFIGLSGSTEELTPIWDHYDVYRELVEGTSPTNYIINHTARVVLVDQAGNMRLSYGFQTPSKNIASDIQSLLGK